MGERPKGDNAGESELRRRVGLQAEEDATDKCRESETRPALCKWEQWVGQKETRGAQHWEDGTRSGLKQKALLTNARPYMFIYI